MAMPIGVLAIETTSSEAPNRQFFSQELALGLIKTKITEEQGLPFEVVSPLLEDMLELAIKNADPGQIEALLSIAIRTFQGNGINGSTILVDSLVQGQLLIDANTTAVSNPDSRPLAVSLVRQMSKIVTEENNTVVPDYRPTPERDPSADPAPEERSQSSS
jgi:hypothetical protein